MASIKRAQSFFRKSPVFGLCLKRSTTVNPQGRNFSTLKPLRDATQGLEGSATPSTEPTNGFHDLELTPQVSQQLARCLEKELTHELSKKTPPNPRMLSYLEKSGFKLVQTDGSAMVELRKWIKKEAVIVRFTVLDLHHCPIDPAELAPNVFSPEHEHPIKFHAVLAKPGKGSILFDCMIVDTFLETLNVMHYPENWPVQPTRPSDTPRLCHKVYVSMFGNLEDEIKEAIELHLEKRGIDEEMAAFVREYATYKEQNEYMAWLSNTRKFMLA